MAHAQRSPHPPPHPGPCTLVRRSPLQAPLALGTGVGSELRRPLGITIVGGLIVSQLLTLFTTPVIYLGFARQQQKLEAWQARRRASRLAAAGTAEEGGAAR